MQRIWWIPTLLGGWVLAGLGCRDATPLNREPFPQPVRERYVGDGPIHVVATVGMVAEMVQEVGGDRVQVETLCGPGVDPHLFKPTRDHVAKLLTADLIVFAGLHLEGKLNDLLLRLSQQRAVYAVAQGLDPQRLILGDDPGGERRSPRELERSSQAQQTDTAPGGARLATADPHVWMDVALWATAIDGVAECLSRFDPLYASHYETRASHYRDRLGDLHLEGQRLLADVPADQRLLVTSHDAFSYFGQAYDFQVEGVQGLSTDSEAGLQRINQLVETLVRRQVQAVFVESSISPKNMQALLEGAAARGHRLQLGGVLYADSLGPPQSSAASYEGMMRHNFLTIRQALAGRTAGEPRARLPSTKGF